jgi:hypothetical protein
VPVQTGRHQDEINIGEYDEIVVRIGGICEKYALIRNRDCARMVLAKARPVNLRTMPRLFLKPCAPGAGIGGGHKMHRTLLVGVIAIMKPCRWHACIAMLLALAALHYVLGK